MANMALVKACQFGVLAMGVAVSACSSMPLATNGDAQNQNYGVPVMRRTIPERMIDEGIEHTTIKNLPNVSGLENIEQQDLRILVDSFRRSVLLTGEVPNAQVKQNVVAMVDSIKDVTQVYDYLTVTATAKGHSHTLHDNFLKSKILAKIFATRAVKSSQYKIVVRDDTAYVMGYLTPTQQTEILNAIESTLGMDRVVLLSTLVNEGGQRLNDGDIMTETQQDYDQNNSMGGVYGGGTQPVVNQAPINQPSYNPPMPRMIRPVSLPYEPKSPYVKLYNYTTNP